MTAFLNWWVETHDGILHMMDIIGFKFKCTEQNPVTL